MIYHKPLYGVTTTKEPVHVIASKGVLGIAQSLIPLGRKSSVNRHHRTRDIGGIITQQENDQSRDFRWLTHPREAES